MSGFNGAVEGGVLHGYDVVDNLTSTSTTAPLSANMGKTLEEHIQQSTANIGKRTAILSLNNTPTAATAYTLTDSVSNYDKIEIIFVKSGTTGAFVNKIIDKDNVGIGSVDDFSFSAYNNANYNFYCECGFQTATTFYIATYNCVGWTMSKVYVVGIKNK